MLNIYSGATRLVRRTNSFAFAAPFPQRVLTRNCSNFTKNSTKNKPQQQKKPKLSDAMSIVNILTANQLEKLAKKVAKRQKTLPMVLSGCQKKFARKFVIYDKGFIKEAQEFKFHVDTGRSYKLLWKNGEEMDLKLVNYAGTIAAGTTMCEVQGMQIGPLLITASFPESSRLPDNSCAGDLEEGVAELVQICKKNGVEFGNRDEFTSFVDWLMQEVMDGSTEFLYYIVIDGALGDAYDNVIC